MEHEGAMVTDIVIGNTPSGVKVVKQSHLEGERNWVTPFGYMDLKDANGATIAHIPKRLQHRVNWEVPMYCKRGCNELAIKLALKENIETCKAEIAYYEQQIRDCQEALDKY